MTPESYGVGMRIAKYIVAALLIIKRIVALIGGVPVGIALAAVGVAIIVRTRRQTQRPSG
jgi:hypothetical protein